MAFTTVPTFSTNQIVTATNLNTYLRDDTNYLIGAIEPTLTNKSGTTQSTGAVATRSTANANAFTTTTQGYSQPVIGVLMEDNIADGSTGRVAIHGVHTVLTTGAVALGDYLVTTSTAGRAASGGSTPQNSAFAIALTTAGAGAGSVTARLIGQSLRIQVATGSAHTDGGTATGSFTWPVPFNTLLGAVGCSTSDGVTAFNVTAAGITTGTITLGGAADTTYGFTVIGVGY